VREAEFACEAGYDLALLSLGAMREAGEDELVAHCRRVADVLPLFGFYLPNRHAINEGKLLSCSGS
jgi:hypothetical protein